MRLCCVILLVILMPAASVFAAPDEKSASSTSPSKSSYAEVPEFGGPDSTGVLLREDDIRKTPFLRFPVIDRALEPYFGVKKRVNDHIGLAFGFDYFAVVLGVNESLGEEHAASGVFRAFGSWTLLGRQTKNTGSLVYKVEHRHRYTDIPPSALGFEAGYLGLIGPPYSDQGWRLTNLYWQQRLAAGRVSIVAGWLDTTDYLNVYALASPWQHFLNLEFQTGTAVAIPNEGLGAAIGVMLTDQFYVVAGLADQNSDPAEPGDGFDTFFNDHEFFTHVEIGWVSSFDRRYFDNVHVTFWHGDERDEAQVEESWGVLVSATTFVDDHWMPFLRGGYSNGDAALMEATVKAGVGFYWKENRDVLGFGVGWARPSDGTLRDQYAIELFYRFQIAQNLALTPDIQFIVDPALHPDEDLLFFFGLRARLAL